MKKWFASEYLDNGQYGIITEHNEIVIGISLGLSADQARAIAKAHNAEAGKE